MKKAIELKSRGVKMLPSKESSPKNSVRKSPLCRTSFSGRAGVLPAPFLGKSVYKGPSPSSLSTSLPPESLLTSQCGEGGEVLLIVDPAS